MSDRMIIQTSQTERELGQTGQKESLVRQRGRSNRKKLWFGKTEFGQHFWTDTRVVSDRKRLVSDRKKSGLQNLVKTLGQARGVTIRQESWVRQKRSGGD